MEPRAYVSAYLERAYLAAHPELTAAARELVHEDVPQRLEKYATDAHAQALVAYTDAASSSTRRGSPCSRSPRPTGSAWTRSSWAFCSRTSASTPA